MQLYIFISNQIISKSIAYPWNTPKPLTVDIESKVNMFSDDTQLITKTEESIEETFKTLGIYEKASFEK
jgi:hypothetical protein